jgi:uncharacterized membrane protein
VIAAFSLPLDEPLFQSSPSLLAFLSALVAGIFGLARLRVLARFFKYCPPVIWMYFIPMICSSLGIIPSESPLYSPFMSQVVLPMVLVLLVVPSDTRSIARLGLRAVALALFGTLGTVIGAVVSFGLLTWLLPEGTFPAGLWKGVAALGGSWIGGSTDFYAVATGLKADPTILGKLIVVDTICAYTWLGILVSLIGIEKHIDRWNRADSRIVDQLKLHLATEHEQRARPITMFDFAVMIGLALAVSQLGLFLGKSVAEAVVRREDAGGIWATIHLSQVLTESGWGILLVMAASVALSLTRVRAIADAGATPIGYIGLYLLLTTLGARADLREVGREDLWLFVMGAFWLAIHIGVLFVGLRLMRAPLFLGATASMANVGGTASAPVVAASFHPSLAPVGLIMAILCGLIGVPVALVGIGKMAAAIAGAG